MRLRFSVNQKEALLQGINAPESFVVLDLDPKELTTVAREIIAASTHDGHDCTRGPVYLNEDGWASFSAVSGQKPSRILLVEPSYDGLIKELVRVLNEQLTYRAERIAKLDEEAAELNKKIMSLEIGSESVTLFLDPTGEIRSSGWRDTARAHFDGVSIPIAPHIYSGDLPKASPEAQRRYAELCERAETKRAQVIESYRPELEQKAADRERQLKAAEDAYNALYSRLPAELRERSEAGFAKEGDVDTEMRKLARADMGLSPHFEEWDAASELEDLTAGEWAAFKKARETFLEKVDSMTPKLCWDKSYRMATEDDDEDDIDDDGEVLEKANERRQIVIKWRVGKLKVTGVIPF